MLFFFGIFIYGSGTNSSERFFLFSLFLGISQLILAGEVAKMVVFSFFNFFCYFLEFSITSRVGTHMNDFYFFLFIFFSLFLGLPLLILAWKEATMVFFNFFEYFCYFFLIFYYGPGRNLLERFFFILFSLFLSHSELILARREAKMVFF